MHPVQSFLWKDFTAEPGVEYTFIVTALGGTTKDLKTLASEQITIKTEKYIEGKHGIYFNRGVSGSQSYAENFKNIRPIDKDENVLDQKAVDWLSRGLYEGLVDFVSSAKKGQKIRGAVYEFHYPDFIKILKSIQKKGVDVNIVYDAVNYGDENKKALLKQAASKLVKHVRDNQVAQAHNKFFVILDKNDNPLKVWTGSTNISAKGIFGHCDTGHVINDTKIGQKYADYWDLVFQNLDRKTYQDKVEGLNDGKDKKAADIPAGISIFFSPRKKTDMLQTYADLIEGAAEMVCTIYPFNIDKRFQAVFKEDKPYIRYILLDERKGYNTFQTDDKDVEVTAGAYIKSEVDQWVSETNAGKIIKSGVDYLHNKIILVDPLGDTPIVISGSANYSENSVTKNDENTMVIKGDDRVADIYFTEFVRLFDHFSFREWLNDHTQEFDPFLDETGKWVNKYFDNPDFLSFKRKMVFKNMTRAKDEM